MFKFCKFIWLGLLFSSSALASWVHSPDVTVTQVIQWEGEGKVFFTLSNGTRCYIEATEDKNYSLVMALYMSDKTATFHCHQGEYNRGGIKGYRFHRVIAK